MLYFETKIKLKIKKHIIEILVKIIDSKRRLFLKFNRFTKYLT